MSKTAIYRANTRRNAIARAIFMATAAFFPFMAIAALAPNPNPYGNVITLNASESNFDYFYNQGSIYSNSVLNNYGYLDNDYIGYLYNYGSLYNYAYNGSLYNSGYLGNYNELYNYSNLYNDHTGSLENYGSLYNDQNGTGQLRLPQQPRRFVQQQRLPEQQWFPSQQ